MARCYCGFYGIAFDAEPGGACPECGRPASKHRKVPAGTCGAFAPCSAMAIDEGHGHPCKLPPGHDGRHDGGGCE